MFKVKSSNYGIDIGNLPVAVRHRIDETNLGYWFRRYLKQFQTGTNPREAKEMAIADLKAENNRLLHRIVLVNICK